MEYCNIHVRKSSLATSYYIVVATVKPPNLFWRLFSTRGSILEYLYAECPLLSYFQNCKGILSVTHSHRLCCGGIDTRVVDDDPSIT